MNRIGRAYPQAWMLLIGLVCGVALASLSGCGTTQALQAVTPPAGHTALVYFIRDNFPPYIHVARLSVNGVPAATLANKDVVAVNVPVGNDRIRVDVTDGKTLQFDMPVDKADTRYVVITGKVENVGVVRTGFYGYIGENHWFGSAYPVSEAKARTLLAGFGRTLP